MHHVGGPSVTPKAAAQDGGTWVKDTVAWGKDRLLVWIVILVVFTPVRETGIPRDTCPSLKVKKINWEF